MIMVMIVAKTAKGNLSLPSPPHPGRAVRCMVQHQPHLLGMKSVWSEFGVYLGFYCSGVPDNISEEWGRGRGEGGERQTDRHRQTVKATYKHPAFSGCGLTAVKHFCCDFLDSERVDVLRELKIQSLAAFLIICLFSLLHHPGDTKHCSSHSLLERVSCLVHIIPWYWNYFLCLIRLLLRSCVGFRVQGFLLYFPVGLHLTWG